jgi:hypothetical protein
MPIITFCHAHTHHKYPQTTLFILIPHTPQKTSSKEERESFLLPLKYYIHLQTLLPS